MPLEVIITNQPIASAELGDNSVHSALRGGVSNGITSENRSGRFQMYSVLSSFPFLDPSGQALRLRGGVPSAKEDAYRQMGLLLAHEIGHQLLHLGHPFNNPHCVMTPPVRLEFAKWAQGLAADKCPLKRARPTRRVPSSSPCLRFFSSKPCGWQPAKLESRGQHC